MKEDHLNFVKGNSYTLTAQPSMGNFTYQWLNNNTIISGATNSAYTVTQGGSYTVIISNGLCSDTSFPCVVTVYPNPTPIISQNGLTLGTSSGQGTYKWYLNNQIISGATNDTYTITQNGSYKVVVTDTNGCNGTSNVIVITNLSIIDVENYSVHIFPQPNNGNFVVNLKFATPVTITVSDLKGSIMPIRYHQTNKKIYVQVANPIPGIYSLKIIEKENSYTAPLIIQ